MQHYHLLPVFRRIAKYLPATVLVLLVVAWVVSAFGTLQFTASSGRTECVLWFSRGSIGAVVETSSGPLNRSGVIYLAVPNSDKSLLGLFDLATEMSYAEWYRGGRIPILVLLTILLPLTLGPLFSFRFRLWHYLAYTALVAVELAYYLQWQR